MPNCIIVNLFSGWAFTKKTLLNFVLFSFAFSFVSPMTKAEAASNNWEVAILFLGKNESSEYQKDVDQNIRELARMNLTQIKLSVFREFQNHSVEFFPDPKSKNFFSWKKVFSADPGADVPVYGDHRELNSGLFDQDDILKNFLQKSFTDPKAHRMLIIYGHGVGFDGFKAIDLPGFKKRLTEALPTTSGTARFEKNGKNFFDLVWIQSCFMGSLEVLYQLKDFSPYIISSQDSEFSSGAVFDDLELLTDRSSREAAVELAQRYIESYSYTHDGEQKNSASSTSATVNVIETAKLPSLVNKIKLTTVPLIKNLSKSDKTKLSSKMPQIQMEKSELVDFGSLIYLLKDKEIGQIIETSTSKIRRTTPRVGLRPPQNNQLVVFGFQNWKLGDEKDSDTISTLPKNLTPKAFVTGPNEKKWPARLVQKRIYVSPFSVNLNTFNYFFANPTDQNRVSADSTFVRTRDFFTFNSKSNVNPIIFYGYTQGKNSDAERYHGISIANPFKGLPSLDYANTDFFKETKWSTPEK